MNNEYIGNCSCHDNISGYTGCTGYTGYCNNGNNGQIKHENCEDCSNTNLSQYYQQMNVYAGLSPSTPFTADLEILFNMAFQELTTYCNLDYCCPIDYSLYDPRFLSLVAQLGGYMHLNKGKQNVTNERLGNYSVSYTNNDDTLKTIYKMANKFRRPLGWYPKRCDDYGSWW